MPGKFVAVRFGQGLERKFAGAIETHRRENHAAGDAADVHEHPAALAAHVREHRAIYAHRTKKIGVHQAPRLFGGDCFLQPRKVVAGIVDGHVDAAGFGDGGIHGLLHRGVVGYIQFKDVYRQRILLRQRADFRGILGVAASGVTHRRENSVPFASQRFGEQSAKAGAGAGDKNYLLGTHDHPLFWAYSEPV